jgi:putative addiction module CopG family antidote
MIVTLPAEIEKIVAEKISSSGAYQSADEVISKSVRLLEAKEKGTEALRREIMRGFEDIQEGRFSTVSSDEELDAFSDDIIRQAKERRDASKK